MNYAFTFLLLRTGIAESDSLNVLGYTLMETRNYFNKSSFLSVPMPIYFDEFIPYSGCGETVVMLHGGAHSGACYLTTPDNRLGWAHDFARMGFHVLVPDWPGIGKSGCVAMDDLDGGAICDAFGELLTRLSGPVNLLVHSMSGPYGLKLLETHGEFIKRLIAIAPGQPGNIQKIPEILFEDDQVIEVQGLSIKWTIPKTGARQPNDELIMRKFVGNSSRFPLKYLDDYKASLVSLPHRLSYQRQNVRGSQIRVAGSFVPGGQPILIMTGSHDIDHPREVDQEVVDWLTNLGARVKFDFLADSDIIGNGHMLMLEGNSSEIAQRIIGWILDN